MASPSGAATPAGSATAAASSDIARDATSTHHPRRSTLALAHAPSPSLPLSLPHRHSRPPAIFAPGRDSLASRRASSSPATPAPAPTPAPLATTATIKRKPLSSTARSSAGTDSLPRLSLEPPLELPKPEQRFSRPLSVDSPTLYNFSSAVPPSPTPFRTPHKLPSADAGNPETRCIPSHGQPELATGNLSDVLSVYDDLISEGSGLAPDAAHDGTSIDAIDDSSDDVESLYAENLNRNPSPNPVFAPKPAPPHLVLEKVDASHQRRSKTESQFPESTKLNKPLPKSPGQPPQPASLFGWSNLSPSVTDFSSIPSPSSPTTNRLTDDALPTDKSRSESSRANAADSNPINYCESYLCTPPPPQSVSTLQVEEMEEELKAIGSELAASIRREMDLEDLVDRLQEQANNGQAPSKRTSDYFSDSGYSSAKLSDYDQGKEEVEKITRRLEQEKATIRLELTNKLQDERSKRKALDLQIKGLAEKASQIDLAQINNLDANDRVKELENTCEDLRRRLSEERQSKSNIEDLLSALKGELQDACNERDNLREEVVPQLRARVEGLESEAASYADLTYESTKMQQQLQSLQQENSSLRNSPGGIPEELGGLPRSNSVAAGSLRPRGPLDLGALSRSGSVKNAPTESREQLAERLKDVEAQRDALHSALKNLLERQEFQNRENQKKIQLLESERQRLLSDSPKKAGFEKDISNLRTEINVLRRRAEDALEQKWQVEKGLVGLKMDLDRAEEEIASLRSLLKGKDILMPPSPPRSSSSSGASKVPITSESLEKAYRELQDAYKESLERIKKLELGGAGIEVSDEKTKLAMQRLERSLSAAVFERDAARQQAAGLESRVAGLTEIKSKSVAREKELADELGETAQRVEQLAAQVRQQLTANSELRDRLSDAVSRGDAERKAYSDQISGLQERLHVLEERLIAAQSASEDRVGRHEEEIAQLREAHNEQLRRIKSGAGVGMTPAPKSPLLKSEASKVLGRSSQALPAKSIEEEVEVKTLRERVGELEKALADAEKEIQEVVGKMSMAQIEVMNLQEERETAVRETKRLQKIIAEEQSKSFEERFKTLKSNVA